MFSTKGQEVKTGGGVAKSLQPGVVYAHIYSGSIRTSRNGDKKALELILETPAIADFEGWPLDKDNPEGPKFKGQSSKITASMWTDQYNEPNVAKNEIINKLAMIANELGLKSQLDQIQAASIEGWVEQAIILLKDRDLFFFIKGQEEDYNGRTIIKLSLPKYKFCSLDENKLDKFDKSNVYHYKSLQTKPVSNFEPVNDDFM